MEPASASSPGRVPAPGAVVASTEPASPPGMPKITVALDDPRLADVREGERLHDWSGAARALDSARSTATLTDAEACAWSYVGGRLHMAAGEMADAAAAFERAVAAADGGLPCPLGEYAALRRAQALTRLGRYDEALASVRDAVDQPATHDERQLVLADAYLGKGDRASALPIWRALLAASPHGVRWVDVAFQLATALLDGVDGPTAAHAQEAFDLATRVLLEAPAVADRLDVAALRARAWASLGRREPTTLSPEERAQQVQAWSDGGQPRHAIEAADALLKAVPRGTKEHHEAACKAAVVRAQAKTRVKADDAADAWGTAISRCAGEEALVTALYYGAKASASAHRPAEALERFARVEKLFPKHRLADDACFRAAVLACDEGDETRGLAQLSSLPDVYPDGDMAADALFRVALARLVKQDLEGARLALDRMLAAGLDGGRLSAGRGAYFRARVAQLEGSTADAEERYAALIRQQPLDYYMLLAYARLRSLDDAAARAAIEAGEALESAGPFLTRDHPELTSPAFERFARLLEVGEIESARREAHAGGLLADGVDSEVLWTIGWLYERAGAPDVGHWFARSRLFDYRSHWPQGRWRFAWEVAYPRAWEDAVARRSDETHVPAPLTWAIMREESAFNPDARSVADAIGLMQLIAPTARATARGTVLPFDEESLRRPDVSIALGTRLLSSLRASFPANPALAIAAYNGGARAVRRWLSERGLDDFDVFVERIPFEETRLYIKRVLASEAAYAYLYAPKALDELLAIPMRSSTELLASP